jgi:hypothetical protein
VGQGLNKPRPTRATLTLFSIHNKDRRHVVIPECRQPPFRPFLIQAFQTFTMSCRFSTSISQLKRRNNAHDHHASSCVQITKCSRFAHLDGLVIYLPPMRSPPSQPLISFLCNTRFSVASLFRQTTTGWRKMRCYVTMLSRS